MFLAIVGDEVEVIGERSGQHLGLAKLVAVDLSVELDEVNERLEDHKEDGRAVQEPLERCL